jgi:hypothetical protein
LRISRSSLATAALPGHQARPNLGERHPFDAVDLGND